MKDKIVQISTSYRDDLEYVVVTGLSASGKLFTYSPIDGRWIKQCGETLYKRRGEQLYNSVDNDKYVDITEEDEDER